METTNILIPTDFSLASLNAVTALIKKHPEQKFNIFLVHFLSLSDSISDLLMLSRRNREYQHISPEFEQQVNAFRQCHPQNIIRIHAEFFYGNTVAVLKNYLEARDITTIAALHDHTYLKLTKNSIDPTLLMQRSGCRLINLASTLTLQTNDDAIAVDNQELQPSF